MTVFLLICIIVCALQAIRVSRLLHTALWLAGASALTSLTLYNLGAPQAAVIELSVGAGLVFILFVFAINLAPGDAPRDQPVVPLPVALTLAALLLLLLGELAWPRVAAPAAATGTALSTVLWQDRQLDALVQIALIFAGTLTVAGLLAAERRLGEAPSVSERGVSERARPVPPVPAQPLPQPPPAVPAAFVPAVSAPAAPLTAASSAAASLKPKERVA